MPKRHQAALTSAPEPDRTQPGAAHFDNRVPSNASRPRLQSRLLARSIISRTRQLWLVNGHALNPLPALTRY